MLQSGRAFLRRHGRAERQWPVLIGQLPAEATTRAERRQIANRSRNRTGLAFQRYRSLIDGQAVKSRPIQAGERLELVQRAFFIEHLGIGFEGKGRVEDAGAAAARLLGFASVRSAVGPEEEFG